jgi:membrane protein
VAVTVTFIRWVGEQPPRGFWAMVLSFAVSFAVGVFVPWILLSGTIGIRMLLPGATLVAVVMAVARPVAAASLPRALDASAARYGSIGVAFTYLACLYAVAFCWLVAAVVGQVVATDEGSLGRWVRRDGDAPTGADPGGPSEVIPSG